MRRILLTAVIAALAVSFGVERADATHSEPPKAKKLKAELVAGYNQCTAPNTTTGGVLALPACSPPIRNDQVCSFGPKAKAKFLIAVSGSGDKSDVKFKAILKEVQGCEGETLCPVVSARVTTDNCSNAADCTSTDIQNLQIGFPITAGCCVVTDGKCKIKGSVNDQIAGVIVGNNNAGFELLGCGVTRVTGGSPPSGGPSFSCGIVVP